LGETSWTFLLVGSFAAVGAALAVGTLLAILRYHRTGVFPGREEAGGDVTTVQLVALWVRVGIGVVLAAIGVWALVRAELI
jgi:hypothetical protein